MYPIITISAGGGGELSDLRRLCAEYVGCRGGCSNGVGDFARTGGKLLLLLLLLRLQLLLLLWWVCSDLCEWAFCSGITCGGAIGVVMELRRPVR